MLFWLWWVFQKRLPITFASQIKTSKWGTKRIGKSLRGCRGGDCLDPEVGLNFQLCTVPQNFQRQWRFLWSHSGKKNILGVLVGPGGLGGPRSPRSPGGDCLDPEIGLCMALSMVKILDFYWNCEGLGRSERSRRSGRSGRPGSWGPPQFSTVPQNFQWHWRFLWSHLYSRF